MHPTHTPFLPFTRHLKLLSPIEEDRCWKSKIFLPHSFTESSLLSPNPVLTPADKTSALGITAWPFSNRPMVQSVLWCLRYRENTPPAFQIEFPLLLLEKELQDWLFFFRISPQSPCFIANSIAGFIIYRISSTFRTDSEVPIVLIQNATMVLL